MIIHRRHWQQLSFELLLKLLTVCSVDYCWGIFQISFFDARGRNESLKDWFNITSALILKWCTWLNTKKWRRKHVFCDLGWASVKSIKMHALYCFFSCLQLKSYHICLPFQVQSEAQNVSFSLHFTLSTWVQEHNHRWLH